MMNFQNSPTLGEETMTLASRIRRGGGTGRARIEISMMLATAVVLLGTSFAAAQAWEPTKPVQFIIPAGTGGGADQMARFIQGVVAKNNLMKQPIITLNKGGG